MQKLHLEKPEICNLTCNSAHSAHKKCNPQADATSKTLKGQQLMKLNYVIPRIETDIRNPISVINEYAQSKQLSVKCEVSSSGPSHKQMFSTVFTIGDDVFPAGIGSNKKESKVKAAEIVLHQLKSKVCVDICISPGSTLNIHDQVGLLVNKHFLDLLKRSTTLIMGRKIIAGIVLTRTVGINMEWKVISLGSGNRCVPGDQLSLCGETVNDCHAEIIARRGFLRYLYKQIFDFQNDLNKTKTIFEVGEYNRLKLKQGIGIHLYISTTPCGDGSIFATSDVSVETNQSNYVKHYPIMENRKQGILRTKVEKGEGCIPTSDNIVTWDGLVRGERLRIMSCCDKIAKWNFAGLQGALLNTFIEPIYLETITIGCHFHHGHLTRALCCRVDKALRCYNGTKIPIKFKIGKVSGKELQRQTGKLKTREFSLNWSIGDEQFEVIDGSNGRCQSSVSRLSKCALYAMFKQLSSVKYLNYREAKQSCSDYQKVKRIMFEALQQAGFGKWSYKPPEESQFS
ncbi:double-stranded RNA-specific adenosine deaminase-like isoform X2 [Ciona intestinalis]